jgi:uncharacterized membrane protein
MGARRDDADRMALRAARNGTAIREYAAGSLWVVPAVSAAAALVAGLLLSQVRIASSSPFAPLVFEGTADDARTLLIAIASTVVTVIALVLGLTVVALQLSSTQFSPRLLRNFLRDGATQGVLGVYLATFAYSAAGLYTVGVAAGRRVEDFPRLAVTGAMVLLFATLGMVVYFADHLAHSLQIDRIAELVQSSTLAVVRSSPGTSERARPTPPTWAVPIPALRSGYVETAHPHRLLPLAAEHQVTLVIVPWVGQHVIEGTRSPGSGGPQQPILGRIRPCSGARWAVRCGSASSAPSSRTADSGCVNSWTSRARRSLRRSTTRIPRSRRSSTSRSCAARSPRGRSATTSRGTRLQGSPS